MHYCASTKPIKKNNNLYTTYCSRNMISNDKKNRWKYTPIQTTRAGSQIPL